MAQYFTDFSEYTTNAIPSGWEEDFWENIPSTSFTVQEVSAISPTGGKAAQLRSTPLNARVGCAWQSIGSINGDVDVYSRVRFTHSINQIARIYICMGGSPSASTHGYFINLLPEANQVALVKYYSGNATNLGVINYNNDPNTYYKLRLQKTGNTIRAKIWADTALEPGTWNIGSVTDSSNQSGYVGIGTFGQLGSGQYNYWDVFSVGTGADLAPRQANTPPVVSVAPVVAYGGTYGRLGTGNTPVTISFTAVDTEQTGTNELSYTIKNASDATIGSGTCTSGVEKQHQINSDTIGLVNGSQELSLIISDGAASSTPSNFILLRDTIAPTISTITYEHEYGE